MGYVALLVHYFFPWEGVDIRDDAFIAKNEFRHPMQSRNKAYYLGTGGNEKKEVLVEFGEWLLGHIQYPIP